MKTAGRGQVSMKGSSLNRTGGSSAGAQRRWDGLLMKTVAASGNTILEDGLAKVQKMATLEPGELQKNLNLLFVLL